MSMTIRKCLSAAAGCVSLLFCGLLLLSAMAAVAHNNAAPGHTTEAVTSTRAR